MNKIWNKYFLRKRYIESQELSIMVYPAVVCEYDIKLKQCALIGFEYSLIFKN